MLILDDAHTTSKPDEFWTPGSCFDCCATWFIPTLFEFWYACALKLEGCCCENCWDKLMFYKLSKGYRNQTYRVSVWRRIKNLIGNCWQLLSSKGWQFTFFHLLACVLIYSNFISVVYNIWLLLLSLIFHSLKNLKMSARVTDNVKKTSWTICLYINVFPCLLFN